MTYAAILVFASALDCAAYVEAHGLQSQHTVQCVLIEPDYAHLDAIRRPMPRPLAPLSSPRPRPRP